MLALSRREQVLCAFLLVVILCVSVTGAWLTWRTLQDQEVQLKGQSATRTGGAAEHSLDTDLTKREGFSLTSPAAPASGSASGETTSGSGPSLQTSQPTTIDGTVVAAVVTVVLVGAAAGAARLVLARYRREHAKSAHPRDVHGGFVDLLEEEPDDTFEEGAPEQPVAEQPETPESRQQPAEVEPAELQRVGIDAFEGQRGTGSLLDEQPTALREAESLLNDRLIPAPRASRLDARQEAPVGGGTPPRTLAAPVLQDSSSFAARAHDAASENIFDRRAARRVPYVQPAWLWWGDADGQIMVQDISATGLRLRFPPSGPAQPPGLGQSLRVVFPVSGTTVTAQGRVQWKRNVDGAIEVGLQFLNLPAADQELIQTVLLTAK